MANKHTLELIETYIDLHAERRSFNTRSEYLAWRSGLLAGLIGNLCDKDSLIRSALVTEIKKMLK